MVVRRGILVVVLKETMKAEKMATLSVQK